MSVAVSASARHVPALAVSLLLHCALLLLPLLGWHLTKPVAPVVASLPNSVAMEGTSIEVEAPTPELANAPAQAEEIPVEREAKTQTEAESETEPELAPPAPRDPPRPRPPSRPRAPAPAPTPAPAPAASSEASAGTDAHAGAPSPGTFGADGLAPGVRRLGYAFTRAIPAATPADSAWKELPAGLVGTIRIELSVGDDNRLGDVQPLPPRPGEPPTPAALKRMVERTVILLRAGQFALSGSNQPGKELLIIEVRLRDEAAEEDASGVVVHKKFDGATPGRPGSAYFRYDTGRVFEAKVTTMPALN
jgi:outer membrane biosynthesis protein TonB